VMVAGGGGVSSMLITELSTYVLGSKGVLLSAKCKTEVGPRWSHMLPHSKLTILPFSLVQSLGLVREKGLSQVSEQFLYSKGSLRGLKCHCWLQG
jgi:hypothetical protein